MLLDYTEYARLLTPLVPPGHCAVIILVVSYRVAFSSQGANRFRHYKRILKPSQMVFLFLVLAVMY